MAGRGIKSFQGYDTLIDMGEESSTEKIIVGLVVALGSFSASSPHFFLNLLTVFSCSISLVSLKPLCSFFVYSCPLSHRFDCPFVS